MRLRDLYPNLDTLAARYDIKDPTTIGAMTMFMDSVARRAANVYVY